MTKKSKILSVGSLKSNDLDEILNLERTDKQFSGTIESLSVLLLSLKKDLISYKAEDKEYLTLCNEAVLFSQLFRVLTLMNDLIHAKDKSRRDAINKLRLVTSKSKLEKAKSLKLTKEEIQELLDAA
jgi:hypothetical protein